MRPGRGAAARGRSRRPAPRGLLSAGYRCGARCREEGALAEATRRAERTGAWSSDPQPRAPGPGGDPRRPLFIEGAAHSPSWRRRRQLNILPRYGWGPGAGAGSPASARGPLGGWGAYRAAEPRGSARARAAAGRARARAAGRARDWVSSGAAAGGGRALCAPGVEAGGGPGSALSPRPAPPAAPALVISPSARGRRGSARGPGRAATRAVGGARARRSLSPRASGCGSPLSPGFPTCTWRS